MKKGINKSLLVMVGALSLLATNVIFASSGRKAQCKKDIKEMRAEIVKWHGPVHALNAMIDSIGKGPYKLKGNVCSHTCATWAAGEGTCTWTRGVWTTTLRYSQP